ncbi:MAG: choice-of-anchor L domain-containing protein, partial [Bacteroidetes bacterium]|nr:choice-of-anchor L domain-containing protein [Bacteroidota bacterium]
MAMAVSGRAQLTVVEGSALSKTPEQLVAEWLIGNGVSISNVTFNGSGDTITSNQIGTFVTEGEAFTELNLEAGILMNSGSCQNAVGPNGACGTTANTGSGGDPDLNILAAPNSTNDKAVLEFDFIPESDTILFRYVFGSEEFYNYCNSNYNDVFGFFLSGPGISGPFSNNAVNIALMPGSSNYVGINNLCDDFLSNWCNAPVLCPPTNIYENCNNPLGNGENFQYNGLTYVFTATYVVIPCSTYHIKLAIADAGDSSLDSGVFLEKNSFSAVGLSINTNFTMPSLGERTIEGCADAIVSFILPEATPTPYVINFNIGGTAINGVDYTQIPDSVVIPAGEDSVGLVIHPLFDGIPEGVETVILEIVQPGCFGSQYIYDTILIYDNTPFFVNGGEDDTICAGDSATLEATAWGGQRPYDYNWEGIGGDDSIVKVSPPPGTYEYVILVEEGCGVEESDTMELLVKPIPSISTGPFNDTICSGDTLSIPLIASITGSAISWTATNLSGNISGHSPGSGDTISQQLFNTSYLLDSLEYTVGATIDGCPGHDTSIWVFVRPLPDLVFTPPELGICNGQTTAIALSSNVANTNFSWTATSGNPNISGYNDGAGDTIQQTLFTSDPASDTVSYHVTANSNGCNSQVTDYPVIVNPVPLVTVQPMWDTICSYEFTNIQLSASCFGTNFSWIATQGVGNITGFSDGSGSQINQQLTNPLSTIGSVVYSITPYTSSCTGQDTNFTMWVKPTPLVTNVPLGDSICNNATLNLLLTSDVSGATFTWTCTPSSANLTGWSEQPTPSTLINQTFSNNGYDIETVTYHITPDFSGCSGPVTDYIVTVYPTPDLSNNPASHSQCNGQIVGGQPGGLPLQSNVANTTFTWRAFSNSPNISGFFDHTGMGATAIEDTLVNSGFTVDTVTYRILPSANGCDGDSTDYLVVVFPTPDLSNQATTQSQCNGQPTGLFLQSNVSGTLFTWTAFGSSLFVTGFSNSIAPGTLIDQTLVNSGYEVDTVTYLIVPQINGCEGDTIPFTVVVFPVADVIFVPDGDTVCSRQPTGISLQS